MPSVAGAGGLRRQLNHLHANHTAILHWHYGDPDKSDDLAFEIHGETLLYLLILFSLIILVSLLLLYARSFFRLRHLPLPSSSSNNPQFILHIPRRSPISSSGLDRASIDSIPIILHQSPKANWESECCICLGAFEDGDKVKLLPSCGHRYHCDCVDAWLREHDNCPLCRLPLAPARPL